MSKDDVLFGYRLQVFDQPGARRSARPAGCSGSIVDLLRVEAAGGAARVGDPAARVSGGGRGCPTSCRPLWRSGSSRSRSGIPAWARSGSRAELARREVGRRSSSQPNGVWRCWCRHGLNTRAKRLALIAGYRGALPAAARARPERHIDVAAARRAGRDRLLLRRPAPGHQGSRLAADRDRHRLLLRAGPSWSSARAATRPRADLLGSRAASPRDLPDAGWQLRARAHRQRRRVPLPALLRSRSTTLARPPHLHPRRPPPDQRRRRSASTARSSKNAGAPPSPATSTSASPASSATSPPTSTTTTTTASTTAASPADASPQTSSTVPARWRRDEPQLFRLRSGT